MFKEFIKSLEIIGKNMKNLAKFITFVGLMVTVESWASERAKISRNREKYPANRKLALNAMCNNLFKTMDVYGTREWLDGFLYGKKLDFSIGAIASYAVAQAIFLMDDCGIGEFTKKYEYLGYLSILELRKKWTSFQINWKR